MKLSEIKGERSLEVIADVMELVEKLSDDKHFEKLIEALKKAKGDSAAIRKAVCLNMPSLIRSHKDEIIAVMASAAGVDKAEYAANGDVLKDILELLTSDAEAMSFLASPDSAEA